MIRDFFDNLLSKKWEEQLIKFATEEGRDEGAQGLPTDTTPKYSAGENKVRNRLATQHALIQAELAEKVQQYLPLVQQKRAEIENVSLTFTQRRSPDALSDVLAGTLENSRATLIEAAYQKHKTEGDYKKFKFDNKITVDPDLPSSKEKENIIWQALFLITLETVFNGYFWQQRLEGDNIAGLGFAFFLSCLNVVLAFVAGLCLAYKNIKDGERNAWLGFGALMAVVIGVILKIIDYRMSNVGADEIAEIENILIAAYGLLFAGYAAWKGYRYQGTYPGYESAAAPYLKALSTLKEEQELLKISIFNEVARDEGSRLTSERRLTDAIIYLAKTKGDFESLRERYTASINHLNNIKNDAILVFRQTNVAIRAAGLPCPTWFNEPIDKFATENTVVDDALESIQKVTDETKGTLEQIRETLKVELPKITELKSRFQALNLTTLITEADQAGLAKFRGEIAEGIGNHGVNRDSF